MKENLTNLKGDDNSVSNSKKVQDEAEMEAETFSPVETQLYMLRWWIASFYMLEIIVVRFVTSSFGVVNNVYKAYFNISYFVVDWFFLVQIAAGFVATIILVYLTFNSILGFRKLLIFLTVCISLECAYLTVAFAYPILYGLIFIGQITVGFGFRASAAIVATFATNWFPENQIAFILSVKGMSMSIGCMLAFFVPSQLVSPPPLLDVDYRNKTFHSGNHATNATSEWKNEVKWKFMTLYGVLLVICLIGFIFMLIFAVDEPPKPPTIAQAKVRAKRRLKKSKKEFRNLREILKECRSIVLDKVMTQMVLAGAALFGANYLQKVLVGEIVREVFIAENYNSRINKMSGYVLVLFEVGCFVGSLAGGKAVDYFKNHKAVILFSLISCIFTLSSLTVGCYFHNVPTIFVFNTLFGFAQCLFFPPAFDILLEHFYPKHPGVVMLFFVGASSILVIPLEQIWRILLLYINGPAVFIFLIGLLLLNMVNITLVKPNFNRSKASNKEETEPLLADDND